MNADVLSDAIVLAVFKLALYYGIVTLIWLVLRIAFDVWQDGRQARKAKRAAKAAKRAANAISLESYIGMRGH